MFTIPVQKLMSKISLALITDGPEDAIGLFHRQKVSLWEHFDTFGRSY